MWWVLSAVLGGGLEGCLGSGAIKAQANSTHLGVQLQVGLGEVP